jgi:hypothetical protein
VLLISVLNALRPSFEENNVFELVVFCRVVARNTKSFLELGSAYALCCCLARRSTSLLVLVRSVFLCPWMIFVIKSLSFLVVVSFFVV